MGLKNLVKRQVTAALKAIGDLAEDVVLVRAKALGEYDFSLMDPGPDSTVTVVVKGVLLQTRRKMVSVNRSETNDGLQSRTAELIMASDGLHDWSTFDKLRVGGIEYRVLGFEDDGYVVKLQLGRSV
jgi:hypothetical protein